MQLALGTVQFGLRYGVAGRDTAVPVDEARAILARAASLGIRWLDTAAAYGDIAQLPGNALDQRLRTEPVSAQGIEIHLRSVFLQGLLLMPEAAAAQRVPAAAGALARWHAWRRARSMEPLAAALGIVKALPGVSHCVVGVDNLAQLEPSRKLGASRRRCQRQSCKLPSSP